MPPGAGAPWITISLLQRRQTIRSVRPAAFSSGIWYLDLQLLQTNFMALVGWGGRQRTSRSHASAGHHTSEEVDHLLLDAGAYRFIGRARQRAFPHFDGFMSEARVLICDRKVLERREVPRL